MDMHSLLSNDIERIPYSDSLEVFESEYKCQQVIGEGGFGKVRKAYQVFDMKNVAIKYIADKKITSWYIYENQIKCIPMEIALMCRCKDVPGVIKIIKYFKIKEHKGWYIVMERFEKYVDLFDHITNQGHIDEKTAAYFMTQLLNIVTSCHRLGVCHRDIKDENIVIDLETMNIYLIDFGAGGILHSGIYNEFDGTRVYSPPEWIQFKQYHVASLEVWSLGILLYDMVCGNLPFDNDDSIVSCLFAYRRPISTQCQDLIQKCLQYSPDKRINISDISYHQWFSQNSKVSTMERRRRCPGSQIHGPSFDISHDLTATCSNQCPGRGSAETSPFVTPQSSGLEDTDSNSSYNQNIIANNYLSVQKHNKCTNFSSTNFRKV